MLEISYDNLVKYDVLPEPDDRIVELMESYVDRCCMASMLLLKQPFNINKPIDDKTGDTLLHKAVREGRVNVVKTLLSKGAAPRILNVAGQTPLDIIKNEKLKKLFNPSKNEVPVSEESLKMQFFEALNEGTVERAESFIKAGGTKLLMSRDANFKTAMHIAAEKGHLKLIQMLQDKGLDPEAKDKDGRTTLFHGAINGHDDVVLYLLKNGSIRNERDKSQRTPLHHAAAKGHLKVVMHLSHSLDRMKMSEAIDLKDDEGNRPVDIARKKQTFRCCPLFGTL